MDQTSTPQYQGLMNAFGQKKKQPPEQVMYQPPPQAQPPPPPPVDPYMNFADVATGQPPAPEGVQPPQRPSVLKQFIQKMQMQRGK